jgi:hypothetical protein
MGIALFHGDFAWLLGGMIAFAGIMVFMWRVSRGHIGGVLMSAAVWYFVFSIHKGSNSGIMTATVAALLFDLIGWPLVKLFLRR